MSSERLDKALVSRGLCSSRTKAQSLIRDEKVLLNGLVETSVSREVNDTDELEVTENCRYVSRGGLKLKGALHAFEIQVEGRVCLDVGASTGGFTDCLLQHGAAHVICLDVGTAQLDAKLRDEPRVTNFEQTHVDTLSSLTLPYSPTLVVMDVSFVSVLKVLPHVLAFLEKQHTLMNDSPSFDIIALIKPQFEYGEVFPERRFKAVIRDNAERDEVLQKVTAQIQMQSDKWPIVAVCDSAIAGPSGNLEQFVHLRSAC